MDPSVARTALIKKLVRVFTSSRNPVTRNGIDIDVATLTASLWILKERQLPSRV